MPNIFVEKYLKPKKYQTEQIRTAEESDVTDPRIKIDLQTRELILKYRLTNRIQPTLSIPLAYNPSRGVFELIQTPSITTSRLQAYYYTTTPSETTPDYYNLRVDSAHRLYVIDDQLLSKFNLDLYTLRYSLYAINANSSDTFDISDSTTTKITATSWSEAKSYYLPIRMWPKKTYSYYAVIGIRGYIDTSGQTLYVRARSYRTGITSDTYTITSTSSTYVAMVMTVSGGLNEYEQIYIDAYVTGGAGYITNVYIYIMPLDTPYAIKGTGAGFQATALQADSNNAIRVSDYYVYNPGNAETFTTTPLGANATYYSPSRDFQYSRLGVMNVMGYADQASASNGVYIQLSIDGTNWDYQGTTATLSAAGAVSLSQVVTARYARAVWANGAAAQTVFRFGGRYAIAGSENPAISLAPPTQIDSICSICGKDMTDTSDFFVEDGKVYCPKCYANKRWREAKDKKQWLQGLKAWRKIAKDEEFNRTKLHTPDDAEGEVS